MSAHSDAPRAASKEQRGAAVIPAVAVAFYFRDAVRVAREQSTVAASGAATLAGLRFTPEIASIAATLDVPAPDVRGRAPSTRGFSAWRGDHGADVDAGIAVVVRVHAGITELRASVDAELRRVVVPHRITQDRRAMVGGAAGGEWQ